MQIHIKIMGRVQGVGYRSWACRTACQLGVSGWVRNRIAGQVEIWAEGEKSSITSFLTLCRQGPAWARVDRIEPVSLPDAPLPVAERDSFFAAPTV